MWLDAACLEVRRDGRIVPTTVTIAVAVDACGRREVPGMDIGACEAKEAGLA